jgi:hypothetical protein
MNVFKFELLDDVEVVGLKQGKGKIISRSQTVAKPNMYAVSIYGGVSVTQPFERCDFWAEENQLVKQPVGPNEIKTNAKTKD